MSIDVFNSKLLDLVQKNYKGAAYSKLLESFEILQSTNSVEQACSNLFRKSIAPIEPPSQEAIEKFGKGNVSQDFLTLLYIDDMLAQAFEMIKNEQYEGALDEILYKQKIFYPLMIPTPQDPLDNRYTYQKILPFSLGGKTAPTEDEKLSVHKQQMYMNKEMGRSLIDKSRGSGKYPKKSKDLLFRFEIYKGFTQFCQIKLQKPFAKMYLDYPAEPYPVENLDDMAVCAICGMFDRYFSNQDKSFFGLEFIIAETTPRKQLFGEENFYVPINVFINMQIKDYGQRSHYNHQFDTFVQMNNTYKIPDARPALNLSLSNLLASSSFIWDEEIFGVSPREVEAMTNDERILMLAQNQSSVIESCFSYLKGAVQGDLDRYAKNKPTSELGKMAGESLNKKAENLKNSIKKLTPEFIRLKLQIEQVLKEKDKTQKDYEKFEQNKLQAKTSLEEIGSRMGQDSMQVLAEMFRYVEKGVEIPQLDVELSGFDQIYSRVQSSRS